MAITPPSQKRRKRPDPRLDLTSIMDAIFIFNFFLLMSANFIKVYEINSPIPLISTKEDSDDKKKPLALSIEILENEVNIFTGIPATLHKKIQKFENGEYDLVELHNSLVKLKIQNPTEETAILNPEIDLEYEKIVKFMDVIRLLEKTDEAVYTKDQAGMDLRVNKLFTNLIFGNTGS